MKIEPYRRILTGPTIPELLAETAVASRDKVYAGFGDTDLTFGDLSARVAEVRAGLFSAGVRAGDRVAVMLPNHLEHVVVVHALIVMRAVWVPVNTRLRGQPLAHILTDCDPATVLVDEAYADALPPLPEATVVLRDTHEGPAPWREPAAPDLSIGSPTASDVVAIIYTSGTTGPAKGVQVTDQMMRAAAAGVVYVGGPRAGDVFFVWEPLCHIGGAQVLLVPLLSDVRLALVDRFSVSAFWQQVTDAGATHIHHLGGIIPMLLTGAPSAAERDNPVRISWGGGMTCDAWRDAEKRFGLTIRECYGMTETASIATANRQAPRHGVGQALPWFDVEIQDESGQAVGQQASGEIVVRPRLPGMVTPGYFRNPDATRESRRGDWWRTGDRGQVVDGDVHFVGRFTDSVRHRGENVSAWEVETVVNAHPAVAESAVVGVPAVEGDEDIKVYVTLAENRTLAPEDLITWCGDRLATYQVPRYVATIDTFTKTPSLRIQKAALPRTVGGYDARADKA